MARLLPLIAALLLGCSSRSEGTLGVPPATAPQAIDVAKLTNAAELERALRQDADRTLGAHSRAMKTELVIDGPDKQETLTLSGSLVSNGKDRLRVVHETSHEDGYEAILEGDRLHVRPRYLQLTWHRPEPGELTTLRAPVEQATADYVARLGKSTITREDKGDRVGITVTSPSGTARLELDAGSGALLLAVIDAKVTMDRQGKPVVVTIKHEDKVSREAPPIDAPTGSVPAPRRPRPQLDKQTLLGR